MHKNVDSITIGKSHGKNNTLLIVLSNLDLNSLILFAAALAWILL